jgi:hypothetical protein
LLKKLSLFVIFCFLAFAFLSNRFFLLGQWRFPHIQKAGFHGPLDNAERSRGRTIVPAAADEEVSDLRQLARASDGIETVFPSALQDRRVLFTFSRPVSLRPPTYILQSALNL